MKALITGIGGFVAGHLMVEMAERGHQVWGAGRMDYAHPFLEGGRSHVLELSRADQVEALLERVQPNVIIHLAAQSNPSASWQLVKETFESNVYATIELVRAAGRLRSPARVLYISSSDVYGKPDDRDLPLSESAPVRPSSPYAVSKLAAEQCARMYGDKLNVEVVVLRPFSHTGPGQSAEYVVPSFASQIAQIECGRLQSLAHGNLLSYRDFTDVRDIVRAYRLVAEAEQPEPLYNVCSGRSTSIQELLTELCGMSTTAIQTRRDYTRSRSEDHTRIRGDASALLRSVGWRAAIPLTETLRTVLDEHRMLQGCAEQAL